MISKTSGPFILCLIIIGCVFFEFESVGQPVDKIMVLGNEAKELTYLHDRILRELVMKKLIAAGFTVVPVMEVEEEIQQHNTAIRNVDDAAVFGIAGRHNARWAINGSLWHSPRGRKYLLSVFDNSTLKKYSTEIEIDGFSEFSVFRDSLAKAICDQTASLIRKCTQGKE